MSISVHWPSGDFLLDSNCGVLGEKGSVFIHPATHWRRLTESGAGRLDAARLRVPEGSVFLSCLASLPSVCHRKKMACLLRVGEGSFWQCIICCKSMAIGCTGTLEDQACHLCNITWFSAFPQVCSVSGGPFPLQHWSSSEVLVSVLSNNKEKPWSVNSSY